VCRLRHLVCPATTAGPVSPVALSTGIVAKATEDTVGPWGCSKILDVVSNTAAALGVAISVSTVPFLDLAIANSSHFGLTLGPFVFVVVDLAVINAAVLGPSTGAIFLSRHDLCISSKRSFGWSVGAG
jgi:hypothetical protein